LYDKEKNSNFLVFDLGGGTFDVSILELFDNILEVHAVAGDNYLGGEDFTKVMEKLYYEAAELDVNSLTQKERARVYKQAEIAKKSISDEKSVVMKCVISEKEIEAEIPSKKYELACEDLLMKIREPVKRSLSDAKLKLEDIDNIVLVGGGTKLSVVRDFIIKLFHKFPDTSLNPDEVVALGAAIQAAMKERNEAVSEVILTDVCSFTLGTSVAIEYAQGEYESGHFCPIIERNTVIPASHTERLYTIRDNQDKVMVKVYQGESRYVKNNLFLGELEIAVPKAPGGQEAVDVTYTYDINSLLEVEVKVVSTGESKRMIIKGSGNTMTDEEIEKRMQELAYLKISPRDEEDNKLALLKAEQAYEESLGDRRRILDVYIKKFEDVLRHGSKDEIAAERRNLLKVLEEE
jgi:molecular chaperone HscC